MSYILPRGRWCDIVLNVHAPTEDKTDDMKDMFYEELEHVFHKFPKYHMKILLGYFFAKVGREDIFKTTIGNECLHKIRSDNGVRVVNFATSRKLDIRSFRATDCDTDHYLVVAEVRDRLAVSKLRKH
jgi:hypothetical protein